MPNLAFAQQTQLSLFVDEPYQVLRRPDYVSPTSMAGVCS